MHPTDTNTLPYSHISITTVGSAAAAADAATAVADAAAAAADDT